MYQSRRFENYLFLRDIVMKLLIAFERDAALEVIAWRTDDRNMTDPV